MASERPEAGAEHAVGRRALRAVLFADMVGFSRHVSGAEAATIAAMTDWIARFEAACRADGGALVKTTGDGVLAVFPSASAALDCATAVQRAASEGPQRFRIGIHLGEVTLREGDVHGHAVNVASRLEALAEPGGICVSSEVMAAARSTPGLRFETMGRRRLRNIPGLTMLYRVVPAPVPALSRAATRPAGIVVSDGLRLTAPDGVTVSLRSDRLRGLAACLALSPDAAEPVDRLVALLAPELQPEDGRRRVLEAARRLRTHLGEGVIIADGRIALDPAQVTIDAVEQISDLRRGRVERAWLRDGVWPDRLAAGLDRLGPAFAAWLAVIRAEWRALAAEALELELDRADHPADPALRDAATALLRLEPAHERAARALIHHYRAVANPAAARDVYAALAEAMQQRCGLAPGPETAAALVGRSTDPAGSVRRPGAAEPLRIQLRDFATGKAAARARLAAFRTELMAGLACFRGWSVVEGTQGPRGGPDYALDTAEGDADGGVRLTLTEALTGRLVGSFPLDLSARALGRARREAVGRIAATLEVYIGTDRAAVAPDPAHEAVDAWLEGERLITRWSPESHDAAAGLFADLIARAPRFAPAHASLASLLNVRHIVRPGAPRDPETTRRAQEHADRAVEPDPLDARNQLALGWSAALAGRFDKAALHIDMAARLNPHGPRTLTSCAMGFAFFGAPERAQELLARSLACAPMLLDYQWCYAAAVHFLSGNDAEALAAAERSGDRIVDNPGWRAAALARLGRRDEAAEAFAALVRDVAADWQGPGPATPAAVADWFTGAYPLRRPEDRAALADALHAAAGGLTGSGGRRWR